MENKTSFESLINSNEFKELTNEFNKFNVFEILGAENAEIRHSNILSWLFDPKQTHNLKDKFLRSFLSVLFINSSKTETIELENISLTDVVVFREWNFIDLVIIVKENKKNYIIVIENKIHSPENNKQLKKYYNFINEKFNKNYHKLFVYLVPSTNKYNRNENKSCAGWIDFEYKEIIKILKNLSNSKDESNLETYSLIEQYCTILKRHVEMEDEKVKSLCETLWATHKKELEILIKYKPSVPNKLRDYLYDYINENYHTSIVFYGNSKVWFRTIKLNKSLGKNQYTLRYLINNENNGIVLYLYLESKTKEIKEKVLSILKNSKTQFLRDLTNEIPKSNDTILAKKVLVEINDFSDYTSLEEKLKENWDKMSQELIDIDNLFTNITF